MAEIAQTFSIDPYAAERSKIARQQKFAELLQSQALQPNEKFSYAGIEAPISAAGGLAKALQAGMSGYLQGDAARKEDAANIRQETDYNAANEAFIRGMTSTPEDFGARGMSPATEEDVASRAMSIAQGSTARPLTLGEPVDVLGGLGAPGTEGTPGTAAIPGSYDRVMKELSGLTGNSYAGRLSQQLVMRKIEQNTALQQAAAEREAQFTNAVRLKQTPGAVAPKVPGHITTAEGVFIRNDDGTLGVRLGSPPSQFGATPAGQLQGNALDAQMMNILMEGTKSGNTSSPEYLMAFNHVGQSKSTFDPSTGQVIRTEPNMSAFARPTAGGGLNPIPPTAPAGQASDVPSAVPQQQTAPQPSQGSPGGLTAEQVPGAAAPLSVRSDINKAITGAAAIVSSLEGFRTHAKTAGKWERTKSVAGINTPLNTSFNMAALMAKGQELFDLGVLNGPDLDIIRRTLPDPSTMKTAIFTDDKDVDSAVNQVIGLIQSRISSKLNLAGMADVNIGDYAKKLRPAPGVNPPAEGRVEAPPAPPGFRPFVPGGG